MDLTTTVDQLGARSRPWLAGKYGIDSAISIALDESLFAANSDDWPDDVLPAGLIVAAIIGGATPEYGPWTPDATNGQQYAAGVLLNPVTLNRSLSGLDSFPPTSGINRSSAAMLRAGTLVYEDLAAINPALEDPAVCEVPLWASPAVTASNPRVVGLGNFTFIRRSHLSN